MPIQGVPTVVHSVNNSENNSLYNLSLKLSLPETPNDNNNEYCHRLSLSSNRLPPIINGSPSKSTSKSTSKASLLSPAKKRTHGHNDTITSLTSEDPPMPNIYKIIESPCPNIDMSPFPKDSQNPSPLPV